MFGGVAAGPELGSLLALHPAVSADDAELLDLLKAESRQLAYQQQRVWALMAQLANRPLFPGTVTSPPDMLEAAVEEVRAELLLTRRSARREVECADAVHAQPRIDAALAAGSLDRRRAIVLAEACADLSEDHASRLLDEVLPSAGGKTATELAARVKRVAIALDPGWAERQYKQAVRSRRVIAYLGPDGSATVTGQNLPAEQATASSRA